MTLADKIKEIKNRELIDYAIDYIPELYALLDALEIQVEALEKISKAAILAIQCIEKTESLFCERRSEWGLK